VSRSAAPVRGTVPLVEPELYVAVVSFLATEARLLDEGREEEWFGLLADDLLYTIPARLATEPRTAEIDRSAYRVRDTKANVRLRLDRLATGHAYSEVPPSRTMRLVGSVEVSPGPSPELVDVASALLVYRQRGIDSHFDLIPCRRNDRLRRTDEGLRLVSREVILTETSILTPNLGVIL
jgi:N,N-dimethyl phenylurea N-demethylase beta subunit